MISKTKIAVSDYIALNPGEMSDRIRALNWSETSLGSIETWSQSLQFSLNILLSSPFPMQLLWGSDYIQFYNDAYISIAGAKHPTGLGQAVQDCWPEVWEFIGPLLECVMTTGEATALEEQLLWLDRHGYREECYFTFSYTPVRNESGQICGILVAVQENTQRLISERRLLNLQAEAESTKDNLERVLSSINDVFIMLDRDWRYTYVNSSTTRLLNKSESELLGQSIWEIIPEVVDTPFAKSLQRAMAEQRVTCFEFYCPLQERWFENRVYPFPDGLSLLCVDISDRKRIEVALQQSEERFRQALNNIPDLIVLYDAQRRLQFVNAKGLELSGKSLEDLIGQRDEEIWPPETFNTYVPLLEQTLVTQRVQTQECDIVLPSGVTLSVVVTYVPLLDEKGEIYQIIGITHDITESKQYETELARLLVREQAARETAESANRIKDEFLAVLSHELRTPLNPILGWTQILQTRKLDNDTTTKALETIERNAKLQAQLVEDLLDVSRILRGKLSLNARSLDLSLIVAAAVDTVRLAAEAKAIEIQIIDRPQVGRVLGDPNRLQQMIWNLAMNAVKFTPPGGLIEIKLEKVESYAQVSIRDTGKGISPEFLPHVFEYFRQEDGTLTRSAGGLGLGLAIVHHLVELHAGTIEADSAGIGQGATFKVKLPLIEVHDCDRPREVLPAEIADLAGIKLLIVDDEVDTRDFLAFILKESGARITTVESAQQAWHLLQREVFDVLISDISMPQVDGYMLMRQLREQGLEIPAIALTAYAGEASRQEALAAGFQQHIAKPVNFEELVRAIALFKPHSQS